MRLQYTNADKDHAKVPCEMSQCSTATQLLDNQTPRLVVELPTLSEPEWTLPPLTTQGLRQVKRGHATDTSGSGWSDAQPVRYHVTVVTVDGGVVAYAKRLCTGKK